MSIVLLVVGLVLILVPTDPQTRAIGIGIVTSVAGTWLVTSTGNLLVRQTQVQNQIQNQSPSAPTGTTNVQK